MSKIEFYAFKSVYNTHRKPQILFQNALKIIKKSDDESLIKKILRVKFDKAWNSQYFFKIKKNMFKYVLASFDKKTISKD